MNLYLLLKWLHIVSSVLMTLGMMMMPPNVVSLPADGMPPLPSVPRRVGTSPETRYWLV